MFFRSTVIVTSHVTSLCLGIAMANAAPVPVPVTLTLAQALAIASEYNHDLRLTALTVQAAAAARLTAAASPNPTLTVQALNINPSIGIGGGGLRDKTVDSTMRIDQVFERGFKRQLRMATAEQLDAAAQSDLREARRQLRISVAQAYFDALAADEKHTITQQTAALYLDTVTATQKRLQSGDIARADLARLQIDALRAQNDAVQSEADQRKARQMLRLLLGSRNPTTDLVLTETWPLHLPIPSQQNSVSTDERPDVLAAQARLRAAATSRKLALAQRTRDISIGVQAEHYPTSVTNSQGSGNSFGIAVQFPIFARYEFDGEIRTADIALTSAQEALDKSRDQARSEIQNSWDIAQAAFQRLRRYDDTLLALAQKSADAAEFAYKHGAVGVTDVLDARRTYRAIRLEALAARADYAKSLVAWQAATFESTVP